MRDCCCQKLIQQIQEGEKKKSGITIIMDETPDACGRAAMNTMLLIGQQLLLVDTTFPDVVDHSTVVKQVTRVMHDYKINDALLDAFSSDSAAYNIKAAEGLKIHYPDIVHMRCIAHILHGVGQCITEHAQFMYLQHWLSATQLVPLLTYLRFLVWFFWLFFFSFFIALCNFFHKFFFCWAGWSVLNCLVICSISAPPFAMA